jgi:hypothetical protein
MARMGLVRLSRRSRYLSLIRIRFCSKLIYSNLLRTRGVYVYKSHLITVYPHPPSSSSLLRYHPLLSSPPPSTARGAPPVLLPFLARHGLWCSPLPAYLEPMGDCAAGS